MKLTDLSPVELSAAMRGGTSGWGQHGSDTQHVRYAKPIDKSDRRRRNCSCGCKRRVTHRGFANGVCLMSGCEMAVFRWVRDPRSSLSQNQEQSE